MLGATPEATTSSSPPTGNVSDHSLSETANLKEKKSQEPHRGAFAPPPKSKLSLLKRSWQKLGITPLVIMFMVKGMVAPTIALAIYQRPSVAANYLNFGFVMIVISITTVPILPRGQFIMNLMVSVVFPDWSFARFSTHSR
jgi:hypothetical protein